MLSFSLSLSRFLSHTHLRTFPFAVHKHAVSRSIARARTCSFSPSIAPSLTHAHVRAPNRQGFPLVNSTPLAIENLLDFLTNFDVFIAPSPFAAVAPSLQHLHARIPLWMPGKKAPNARIKCVRLMNEARYTHEWTTSSIYV